MAAYAVKEMFLTLQGEGLQAGRRAVFLRFAGCNLWSGREADRHKADCQFCDTDFVGTDGDGGGRYATAEALADRALAFWGKSLEQTEVRPFTVITGGEPMLQLDAPLIAALKDRGFEIAIETNGTFAVPETIDWICVSPKAGTEIVQRAGNELKMVWPQPGLDFRALQEWGFDHFLVQPMDGVGYIDTREACIAFVIQHPRWRLSVQNHKMIGLR
ncbi:7-carboxy-7-deazaguanine synthase (Cx14CxxC type) [Sphingomonas vulcanisoli]|uniref:7-carboxy-7-deazaguanine synthase n=1 Tax=Sphingomonas vulcanisoli TaxID=1658060 RepID=A0ABX0TVA6_9SPHN|nr:7-carboxy-7-deazaguanine synthase [Sphingomonas vulcanisoli]NIJ08390.1 7-carboxy-7-deazaguanine synthase (Cx14CxxC type) [Sphingomonas vulcanisoli]